MVQQQQERQQQQRADPKNQMTNLLKSLLGNCYYNCAENSSDTMTTSSITGATSLQFVELPGLQVIGLGALSDELSARERVYDTLEQFTTSRQRERYMRLGYFSTNSHNTDNGASSPLVQMVPLDVWNQHFPSHTNNNNNNNHNNRNSTASSSSTNGLTRPVQTLVHQIQNHDYRGAKLQLTLQLAAQKQHPTHNVLLTGITAHNLAVVKILCGDIDDDVESIIDFLQQAIRYKEQALLLNEANNLTDNHENQNDDNVNQASELLASSWDELGIQYFGQGQFDQALQAFEKAIQVLQPPSHNNNDHPDSLIYHDHHHDPQDFGGARAMVLNNIACCQFQLKQHDVAYETLLQARELQHSYLTTRSLSFHKDSHDDDDDDNNNNIGEAKSSKDPMTAASTVTSPSSSPHKQNPATVVVLADLELLYNAIVMGNCAYLCLCLKKYEQARSLLEEALLLQQSVLDNEDHRAIRDTRSNLEFTNAFHM